MENSPMTVNQRRIGLTGGIATGKTTVSHYLEQAYHLPVLDADVYARQGVEPGSPALGEIVQRYGKEILLPGGDLDRSHLGKIIFEDAAERQWLEALIHPWVRQCFQRDLAQHEEAIVVLAIPLLFETGYHLTPWVTETWVVYCSPQQQLDRLRERNGLSTPEAQARIDAQLSLREKCRLADVVLENTGSLKDLYTQVDRALAGHQARPESHPDFNFRG
jgi:dephospho-CoA kinase